MLVLLSALFTFLITSSYFPSFGLTLTLVTLSSLIFKYKKNIVNDDKVHFILVLFFSLALSIWSHELIVFLDIFAAFYFGSLLITNHSERNSFDIGQFVSLPMRLALRFARENNLFGIDWNKLTNLTRSKTAKSQEIGISIFLTILVLVLVLPLLSSANPLFASWVRQFLSFLNLNEYLKHFFGDNFPLHVVRVIIFSFIFFFLPRILSYVSKNNHNNSLSYSLNLPLHIPKLVLVGVLIVFFASQAQLYFATEQTLLMLKMTHSQYAREVFGQLSLVTLIIFGLIYADKAQNKNSRLLTQLLIFEGLFLSSIALKSVYDYSSTFGFTHKRLLGYSVVAWAWGLYGIYLHYFLKNGTREQILKKLIIFSGLVLVCINLLNFDYLIYHASKAKTNQGVDYQYLTSLSPDSYSYHELLSIALAKSRNNDSRDEASIMLSKLLWRVEILQHKYGKAFDLRSFNVSQYRQYLQIKDIDVETYYKILQNLASDNDPSVPVIQTEPIPNN